MGRASTEDPLKAFRFRVEVDGVERAGFSKVSGFEKNTEVVQYREGGQNETAQKSAGLTNYSDIVLERGQIVGSTRGGDNDFYDWASQVQDASTLGNATNYRREFDVVQYNSLNVEVRRWTVFNAWPSKFVPMSELNGLGTENSIESLTLSNEGWQLVSPS